MDRRSFLGTVGTVSVIGVSGCIGPDDTSNPNETPQDETPEELSLTVTDHSFEVVDPQRVPAEPEIISRDGSTFTVGGVVSGKNGCMSARLASDPSQGDSDPLTVDLSVETFKEGEGMCTQAIKQIGFEIEFTYEGDNPEEILVRLDGVESGTYTLEVVE